LAWRDRASVALCQQAPQPAGQETRFSTEAEARDHARALRALYPHPDVLIAVVPLGRPVAASAPGFPGAEAYPWAGRRPA
jgi:hypothetical protein